MMVLKVMGVCVVGWLCNWSSLVWCSLCCWVIFELVNVGWRVMLVMRVRVVGSCCFGVCRDMVVYLYVVLVFSVVLRNVVFLVILSVVLLLVFLLSIFVVNVVRLGRLVGFIIELVCMISERLIIGILCIFMIIV